MSLTIQQGLQKVAGEPYQNPRKVVDKQAFSSILEQKQNSKESLLVYKDMGLIADVHSRTIITAMGMNELHTVTNIDSATFIK